MTTTEPWYTPLAASELEHLVGSLDLLRTTFRWKADGLDSAGLAHPASNLSDTSVLEEDDAEELLVDKTRPTVPTRLEWRHGGDKVYVTGTIFQWNRKTRLHPV